MNPAGPPRPDKGPAASGSILGGAGVLVVGRYAVATLAWFGTVIVIRELSLEEWGEYTLIFGLLGIIGLVADLRVSRIVLRAIIDAPDDAGELLGSYVTLRLAIGVVSYVVAMGIVVVAYDSVIVRETAIAGASLVILSAVSALVLLFEARFWLRSVAVGQVLGQAVQLATTVAIAALGIASVLAFIWTTVASAVVTLLWLLWALRHVVRIRLRVDLARWWEWLREAAPLAVGAALGTVYFRIDIVMLSLLDGSRAVGTYGVGYKFSDLIGALPLAVLTPAMTILIAAWPSDLDSFRSTFRHAYVLLTVGAVGVTIGFGVFAEPLIRTLYTERYVDAVDAARLLVVGQALHFYTTLCFVALVSVGRHRLYPIATLVGAVLNIALNLVLIPPLSYDGSALATVLTEIAVVAVLAAGTARVPGTTPLAWTPTLKCLVAGAAAGGCGVGLLTFAPWPVAGIGCAATYLAVLHLLRVDGPGGLRALAREGRIGGAAGGMDAVDDLGLATPEPE